MQQPNILWHIHTKIIVNIKSMNIQHDGQFVTVALYIMGMHKIHMSMQSNRTD